MAQLLGSDKDDLVREMEDRLSATRTQVSIGRQDVRAIMDVFDTQLEAAEAAIMAGVSVPARTWLVARPAIARAILTRVAEKRKEKL